MVAIRKYNYTDDNRKDDIENYQKWIINKNYLHKNKQCKLIYDVKLIYEKIENGSNVSNGIVKEIRIYAWHEYSLIKGEVK